MCPPIGACYFTLCLSVARTCIHCTLKPMVPGASSWGASREQRVSTRSRTRCNVYERVLRAVLSKEWCTRGITSSYVRAVVTVEPYTVYHAIMIISLYCNPFDNEATFLCARRTALCTQEPYAAPEHRLIRGVSHVVITCYTHLDQHLVHNITHVTERTSIICKRT